MPKKNLQRNAGIYSYIRREWLNQDVETAHTSYILVHVEGSHNGENAHGGNVIYIADCSRVVQFEFYLGTKEAREASIAKLNLLIEILGEFAGALLKESSLIAKVEKAGGD